MGHNIYTLSKSNNLSMYRGDSLDIKVNSIDIPFTSLEDLGVDRCLYLGIMEPNQPFEYAIIRKMLDYNDFIYDSDGNITVSLKPYETELLEEGLYYYQFKFQKTYITSEDSNEEVVSSGKHKLLIM